MIIKKISFETGWRGQFVRIYLVKKGFIEVIWSYCKFLLIFSIASLCLEMISDYLFHCFGTVPSYCMNYRRFFLYGLGWYIR